MKMFIHVLYLVYFFKTSKKKYTFVLLRKDVDVNDLCT